MQEYVVNRPDGRAMDRVLEKNFDNAAGVILRLAWQAGLLREEIQYLTWAQIDFLDRCLVLPDRRGSWRRGWPACGTSATACQRPWCCRTGIKNP